MEKCNIKIINKSNFPLPKYQTEGSAGVDIYANIIEPLHIERGKIILVPTGLFVSMPFGYEAQIRARSGLTLQHGITIANGIGTIDSDFRGEIQVILINLGSHDYKVAPGERIAQMVIKKYICASFEEVEVLDETQRGQGGFGHSGS
ncbi:dUTP diphosphatase [Alkalibaculum sp. M08DMB]|uniref:Deoxyuridine 5'-triphosphate nucleotidohydrolase n=1 Tax=Alkalibaculum sporogenes TaxID=2655001 RepID=A0A6A7K8U6_9FIRM|nr:dUTP diphosphatase [Alkalibaculum sporogenes]MPW25826.1 dUTP diphosphatase [Alkalibaculum sporogenes]